MKRSACVGVEFVGIVAFVTGVALLASPGWAATLYWTGDYNNDWFGTNGTITNWRNAANEYVTPTNGDDVVFTSAGIYTGNLTLGGGTITLNSITVGDASDRAIGGLSDFGVDLRVLATNGTIRLGAGGLNVEFPNGMTVYDAGNTRNYRFDTNFEFLADSRIRGYVDMNNHWKLRQVFLGGTISGGSVGNPITLEVSTADGSQGTTKAITFEKAMPELFGTLKISGATSFSAASQI